MEKKNYIQPTLLCYGVKASGIICGSGDSNGSIGNGSATSGSAPTSTTQNGVTGIFGESKGSSSWDDED